MRLPSPTRAAIAVFYALVILPAGLVMRMLGLDPLRMRHDSSSGSEWEPPEKE